VLFLCHEEDGNQTGIVHRDYCMKDEYRVELIRRFEIGRKILRLLRSEPGFLRIGVTAAIL